MHRPDASAGIARTATIRLIALPGLPEVEPGIDLGALLAERLRSIDPPLEPFDVLVVAQKIVSKAEGRFLDLGSVVPSARAEELALVTGKDARLVEAILAESAEVLRARPGVIIVRHRLGYVMAQAGVDRSNVAGTDRVLLLPEAPDDSAARLRATLARLTGIAPGVVISDSFGRPWRLGTTNIALGAAGVPSLWDRRGELDRNGRPLESTEVAWADAIAAAAGLAMGEAAEGTPCVLVRGLSWSAPESTAAALLRPLDEDLFR
jgi:coenzyme F420-0:L-glutamate ligase/coenzyme F420-1:gamma-L-glutamate ligase